MQIENAEISTPACSGADTTAPAASASKPRKPRLTVEASNLIKEFMALHETAKYEDCDYTSLLERIQATPGNEHYTLDKLKKFIKQRKVLMKKAGVAGSPALSADQLKGLEELYRGQNNPDERIKLSWSSVLKIPLSVIEDFLLLRRVHEASFDAPLPPTPAESTTSIESPSIMPHTTAFVASERARTRPPVSDHAIPRTMSPFEYPALSDQAVLSKLLAPLAALQSHDQPKYPNDTQHYDAAFAPYERSMKDLLQAVSSGFLENWGFHPSMVQ